MHLERKALLHSFFVLKIFGYIIHINYLASHFIVTILFTGQFNLERIGYQQRLAELDAAYKKLETKYIG